MHNMFFRLLGDNVWFGDKAVAVFDLWSITHFVTGIVAASFFYDFVKKKKKGNINSIAGIVLFGISINVWLDTAVLISVSYLWEICEWHFEMGFLGQGVASWFSGVEFWGNRFFSDPLLVYLGYMSCRKFYFKTKESSTLFANKKITSFLYIGYSPTYLSASDLNIFKVGWFARWFARVYLFVWVLYNICLPSSTYIQHMLFA